MGRPALLLRNVLSGKQRRWNGDLTVGFRREAIHLQAPGVHVIDEEKTPALDAPHPRPRRPDMQTRVFRILEAVHGVTRVTPLVPRGLSIIKFEMLFLRKHLGIIGRVHVGHVHKGQAEETPVQVAGLQGVALEYRAAAAGLAVLRDVEVAALIATQSAARR